MGTEGEERDRIVVFILFVGEKSQLFVHSEFIDPHSGQIADFRLATYRVRDDGADGVVQGSFLDFVQTLNGALESWGLEKFGHGAISIEAVILVRIFQACNQDILNQ